MEDVDGIDLRRQSSFDLDESAASSITVGGIISKVVSLKGTIALLSLISICASVGISTSLGNVVCNDALDDTRAVGDKATDDCFDQSSNSLQRKSEDLLVLSSNAIVLLTEVFLSGFYTEIRRMHKVVFVTGKDADKTDFSFYHNLRGMLTTSVEASEPAGVAVLSVQTRAMFWAALHIEPYGFGALINPGGPEYANKSMLGLVDTNGDYTLRFPDFPLGPLSLDDLLHMDVIPEKTMTWTNIQAESSYIGVNLIWKEDDQFGTTMLLRVSASLTKISRFLREVSQETFKSTGASVYLYLVAGSSLYDEVKGYSQNGYLTGVSHGNASLNIVTDSPLTGSTVHLRDVDATNPIIQGIAKTLHFNNPTSNPYFKNIITQDVTANQSGVLTTEPYVIATTNLTFDSLDWWLVSAISTDYILGDVTRAAEVTRRVLDEQQQEVEDDADEKARSVIFINMGVAIVLALSVVIAVHLIWKSTSHLNSAMQQVADMDLDSVSFASKQISIFYEVRQMQHAFQKMVKNLKEYKAYVPTAVLQGSHVETFVDPPVGDVAVVFTDIVSSTRLWDLSSDGMNTALEIHNEVMRKAIQRYNGYEVKTIGDAFMITFTNPKDALQFCFRVQKSLLKQKWPDDLELHPQYSDRDSKRLLWNGIKVRMGCNSGEVITEENPLTGRVDYRGTTVNMASRLEAKALPGTVCISDSLRQKLGKDLASVGSPAIAEHGTHELKGLGGGHLLHIVAPSHLKERILAPVTTPGAAYEVVSSLRSMRSGTSAHSSNRDSIRLAVENKKTGLSLVSGQVTVAICKLQDVDSRKIFEHCNLLVRAVTEAATQTDGVIGSVTGMAITVAWNASQACKMHVAAALRFASQLERRGSHIVKIGVASGTMLHGNIGTHKQRFSTTFGHPLQAAEAATAQAASFGTFCVFADLTSDLRAAKTAAIAPFLRIVDIWFDVDAHRQIILYEALTSRLMEHLEEAWDSALEGGSNGGDVLKHNDCYIRYLGGSEEAVDKLRHILSEQPDDEVLLKVIQKLEKKSPGHEVNYNAGHRISIKFNEIHVVDTNT